MFVQDKFFFVRCQCIVDRSFNIFVVIFHKVAHYSTGQEGRLSTGVCCAAYCFNVADKRTVQFVQPTPEAVDDVDIDTQNIYCGACTWKGRLRELVESHTFLTESWKVPSK